MSTTVDMIAASPLTDDIRFPFSPEIELLFERLLRIDGKAEIVDGRLVIMSPTGAWPNFVASEIHASLRDYAKRMDRGRVVTSNVAFRVHLPHRDSFSPDAGYYTGPPAKMGPYQVAPIFAVEVRSYGDYGPRAERLLAEKREDYFACGTQVVWDVDLRSVDLIKSYVAANPDNPLVFRAGDIANAEPAVPGWSVNVSELMPEDWEPPTTNATSK